MSDGLQCFKLFLYSFIKLSAYCLLINCKLYRAFPKKNIITTNNGTKGYFILEMVFIFKTGCFMETPPVGSNA